MDHTALQTRLATLGHYTGKIDGVFGPRSREAFIDALAAGPDTRLGPQDFERAARVLGAPVAAVRAVAKVEALGSGFEGGLPKILPEPHRFFKNTGGRFAKTDPDICYPRWDPARYPKTQAERWAQLARMVSLDVDAGLKSASYGAFQIMGENHAVCGFRDPWSFVYDQSLTEGDQLDAFVSFVSGAGLVPSLRRLDWTTFARGYNGTGFRQNRYDERLAVAYREFAALA